MGFLEVLHSTSRPSEESFAGLGEIKEKRARERSSDRQCIRSFVKNETRSLALSLSLYTWTVLQFPQRTYAAERGYAPEHGQGSRGPGPLGAASGRTGSSDRHRPAGHSRLHRPRELLACRARQSRLQVIAFGRDLGIEKRCFSTREHFSAENSFAQSLCAKILTGRIPATVNRCAVVSIKLADLLRNSLVSRYTLCWLWDQVIHPPAIVPTRV